MSGFQGNNCSRNVESVVVDIECEGGTFRRLWVGHQDPLSSVKVNHIGWPLVPSRPPSAHTPWSGPAPGGQGGAPHWTNLNGVSSDRWLSSAGQGCLAPGSP